MAAVEEKPTRAASHQGNAVLVHKHVFGLKGDVKGHLHYIDEAQVSRDGGAGSNTRAGGRQWEEGNGGSWPLRVCRRVLTDRRRH